MANRDTPGATPAPRAGRRRLPEWVLLLVVIAASTAIVGGWRACLVSAAAFGVLYVALTKYRARRSRASEQPAGSPTATRAP